VIAEIPLGDWRNPDASQRRLEKAGLSSEAARPKAKLLDLCAGSLLSGGLSPGAGAAGFFVPGRIEVLGKHTDYAGGRSILAAAQRGFCLLALGRIDRCVHITDATDGDTCRFEIDAPQAVPAGSWLNYPMTVARRLARNFPDPPLQGADIAFASDLPRASGMSSSSALMVGTYLALAAVNDLEHRPQWRENIDGGESLGEYLGAVENGQSFRSLEGDKGVGTFGGSEDHIAMLCCRGGTLAQYSYCPVHFERSIAVPAGYEFAVASSGVKAEKTGGAMEQYNRASRLAGAVAALWRKATGRSDPHMAAAIHSGAGAAGAMRALLAKAQGGEWPADELRKRFEHFLAESEEIIPSAGDALSSGNVHSFGRQVDRSQKLAETLLGNQVEETIHLARSARELGAAAASAFGAGFGGSVWALVRAEEAGELLARWVRRYHEKFPECAGRSTFFLTKAGPGAFSIFDF
jgi:galactokinase